jgi:hypothetical protein
MDLTRLIETLGIWGIGLFALFFIFRELFNRWMSRDVEKYKASLQASHDTEIERFRSDLRIAAFERETRFAGLHERRAEVIAELYKRLARMHQRFDSYLSPLQVGDEDAHSEKGKEAATCANDFFDYFNESRIYLDGPLCAEIAELGVKVRRAWVDFNVPPDQRRGLRWLDVWNKFGEDVPPLLRRIEKRFREMLGVEDEDTPA